ncbi:unnamed protein product [Schistosoma bovis]|nr:unnamed protein product [Schistosoma bovis]
MYYTNMICSHRSYLTTRYWIVYSQHELHGHYVIIPPGVCVSDLRERGFWSVGSALKCVKLNQVNHHFYCHNPRITWLPINQSPFGPPPFPDPFEDLEQINYRDQANNNTTTEVPLA